MQFHVFESVTTLLDFSKTETEKRADNANLASTIIAVKQKQLPEQADAPDFLEHKIKQCDGNTSRRVFCMFYEELDDQNSSLFIILAWSPITLNFDGCNWKKSQRSALKTMKNLLWQKVLLIFKANYFSNITQITKEMTILVRREGRKSILLYTPPVVKACTALIGSRNPEWWENVIQRIVFHAQISIKILFLENGV